MSFLEDGRDWILPALLYAEDLILCGELEEELRMIVRQNDMLRCVEGEE